MASDDRPAGFLSRWSRRKVDAREGRVLEEPAQIPAPALASVPVQAVVSSPEAQPLPSDTQEAPLPRPTMADAQKLTPESDFSGFMASDVTPDVKNAAVKKLFTDPHFNVMDGMDVYIEDYSQPDPLPMAMLRQMVSAKTLSLFDDEPDELPVQSSYPKNTDTPQA